MDRPSAPDYGTQAPQPSQPPRAPIITPSYSNASYGDSQAEGSYQDHSPGSQYQSSSSQATQSSDYNVYASASARSGSFPEHLRNSPYHNSHAGSAAPSPTTYQQPYPSPAYAPGPVAYHSQESPSVYRQHHDWPSYAQPSMSPHMYPPGRPVHAVGQQVYSFVPIPGSAQHKRPRRRYEEIDRMYKCGHKGCEKAYGTLNHLNAHVTMQSHGNKRTPEEFKEIRKEWRERKKQQEREQREREHSHRQAAQAEAAANAAAVAAGQAAGGPEPSHAHAEDGGAQVHTGFATGRPTLPPLVHQGLSGQYASQVYPNYGPQNPAASYATPYNE